MVGTNLLMYVIPKARASSFWLWVLNTILFRVIPFNRPHGFRIHSISDYEVETSAPFKRSNQNHLKGIHACGIATVAEFSSGFLLLMHLDPKAYRLIMSTIEVHYHYQAKEGIISSTSIDEELLATEVVSPLQHEDSVIIKLTSRVRDHSGHKIATATTTWQIKKWDHVRTLP